MNSDKNHEYSEWLITMGLIETHFIIFDDLTPEAFDEFNEWWDNVCRKTY